MGRTLSLLLISAGGFPGPGGCPSGQSLPGRYGWCFAENEQENPWEALQVELGYDSGVSTVTLMAGRGTQTVMVYPPAGKVMGSIARAVQGMTGKTYGMPWDQLLILSPAHAHLLAKSGWSKKKIRDFIHEKARLSVEEAEAAGISVMGAEWKERLGAISDKSTLDPVPTIGDRNTLVPITERPENLVIIVAGGTGSDNSTFIPCGEKRVTGQIDKYKPARWRELLKMAEDEAMY